jgi:hypothetical protein
MLPPTDTEFSMPSFNMPRPPSSTRLSVTFVPTFEPSDPKAAIPRSPDGTGGVYRVTFILTKPGQEYFRAELNAGAMMKSGDSLLLLPQGAAGVKVEMFNETEKVESLFSTNSRGALATAQLRLLAPNFAEAQKVACNLILPMLSWWCYRYDVAIDIAGYEVVEEATDVVRYVVGLQGEEKFLVLDASDARIASTPEYRALFAAYREAGNATNPFYQFLCYYRVTEGVNKLRARRREGGLAAHQTYREPPEVIPADLKVEQSLKEFFAPYLGRKFTWILNERLGKIVRNAVAHLDPTSNDLVVDKFEDVAKCDNAIPVIKYIAREMLRNELAANSAIPAFVVPT